jgi:hypothetical protein
MFGRIVLNEIFGLPLPYHLMPPVVSQRQIRIPLFPGLQCHFIHLHLWQYQTPASSFLYIAKYSLGYPSLRVVLQSGVGGDLIREVDGYSEPFLLIQHMDSVLDQIMLSGADSSALGLASDP